MSRYPSVFGFGASSDAMVFWNATSRKAQGTITMSGIASADETFVIDTQTFTWKATRTVAGEVTIGANAAEAVTNIVTAITADLATVTAVDGAGDTVVVTAYNPGEGGDSIVFTEASTNMAVDGTGTLGGTTAGVDSGFYFQDIGTGVFFDNVKLQNPEPFDHNWNPIVNQTTLLTGKRSVQGSTEKALSVSFRCQTGSHQHISDLKEKIGGAYTLKIDEVSYENCYIVAIKDEEWYPGEFEYTISFVQDTS